MKLVLEYVLFTINVGKYFIFINLNQITSVVKTFFIESQGIRLRVVVITLNMQTIRMSTKFFIQRSERFNLYLQV